jgi:hypothetical protein
MKLYVKNGLSKGDKIYLDIVASTRFELSKKIGSDWFVLNNQQFHISEVFAEETDGSSTASGAVVGGLVGTLAGPFGIFLGSLIGGAIGNSNNQEEKEKVESFNNSFVR